MRIGHFLSSEEFSPLELVRIGDGFCTVSPVVRAVRSFRSEGGGSKVVAGGLKVCDGRRAAREDRVGARATGGTSA
jgi:hypothetical protein